MLAKYFLYALIALVALQSIDAMADAVKFHQPNSPYTEADYFPNNNHADSMTTTNSQDFSKEIDDHCCYCHGVNCTSLIENNYFLHALNIKEELITYQKTYRQAIISPDRKPPISHS